MHICINPYAQVPFDLDVFKGQPVAIHTYDSDDGYELYMPPGFLLQRTNYIIEVRDQLPDKKKQSEKTYKKPQQPDILDGILFSVPGVVGGFTATHMAFYKGWTIVIAFDLTDKDWMVQFLQGRHHTIHEYIAANRQQEPGAFIVDKTFGSKEDALTAAQAEIDKHLLST